jgi:O-Antigen ligase
MIFVLCLIYISLYYIRPFEWTSALKGQPLFLIISAVCIVSLIVVLSKKREKFVSAIDFYLLGFLFSIAMSHGYHGYLGGLLLNVQGFLPAIVGYFLIVNSLDSQKKHHVFLNLLFVLAIFLSYECYLQVTTGFADGGLTPYVHSSVDDSGQLIIMQRTRWYGVFNDPNDLALAFVITIPLLIERCFRRQWFFPALSFPPILYGIYSTNSRGAILAMGAGVISYLILRYRSAVGGVVGLIFAIFVVVFGPSRMSQLSGGESSAHGRLDAWYEGYQMFLSSPLFGVGAGLFSDFHELTAHNSYVLVLAELGLFGMFFFTAVFFLPLLWAKKYLLFGKTDTANAEIIRTQACANIGSLVGMMAAMFFLSRSYVLLPFMTVAMVVSYMAHFVVVDDHVNPFYEGRLSELCLFVFIQIVFIYLVVKVLI